MVGRHEVLKRFIETIVNQISVHMDKYSLEDQKCLNRFLKVLQKYQIDTQIARETLFTQIREFIDHYRPTTEYLRLPFLWFAVTYFENANRLLSVADFHGKQFYKYLLENLHDRPGIKGAFQLIREGTPLTDLKWEQLQYSCNKLSVPLTSEQLRVLETIISDLTEGGIRAINKRHLKNTIGNQVPSLDSTKALTRFFSLIDARWSLWYYLPAFGLDRIYFHLQLSESTTLKDIIDFKDKANTTLRTSRVYRIRDYQKIYTGILVIPRELNSQLKTYLRHRESQGEIFIQELKTIDNARRSTSITYYQDNKGWKTFFPTTQKRLVKKLKTTSPRKGRKKSTLLFITPPVNTVWDYHRLSNSSEVIALLCKFAGSFSFNRLPLGSREFIQLSTIEKNLLKRLMKQRVVNVIFFSNLLRLDFSLDEYWIKAPLMPLKQLARLLDWLPYSLIDYTDANIYIQTVLDSKIVNMLKNDLNWVIIPIIEEHTSINPELNWYDLKKERWISPKILE